MTIAEHEPRRYMGKIGKPEDCPVVSESDAAEILEIPLRMLKQLRIKEKTPPMYRVKDLVYTRKDLEDFKRVMPALIEEEMRLAREAATERARAKAEEREAKREAQREQGKEERRQSKLNAALRKKANAVQYTPQRGDLHFTQSQVARILHTSRQAVNDAIKIGRLVPLADGTIERQQVLAYQKWRETSAQVIAEAKRQLRESTGLKDVTRTEAIEFLRQTGRLDDENEED